MFEPIEVEMNLIEKIAKFNYTINKTSALRKKLVPEDAATWLRANPGSNRVESGVTLNCHR